MSTADKLVSLLKDKNLSDLSDSKIFYKARLGKQFSFGVHNTSIEESKLLLKNAIEVGGTEYFEELESEILNYDSLDSIYNSKEFKQIVSESKAYLSSLIKFIRLGKIPKKIGKVDSILVGGTRSILKKIPNIIVNNNPGVTLFVGFNPATKKFRLDYNPTFICKAFIETIINEKSIPQNPIELFFSNFYFFIAHECSHILYGHVANNKLYDDLFGKKFSNYSFDSYINKKIIKDFDIPIPDSGVNTGYFTHFIYNKSKNKIILINNEHWKTGFSLSSDQQYVGCIAANSFFSMDHFISQAIYFLLEKKIIVPSIEEVKSELNKMEEAPDTKPGDSGTAPPEDDQDDSLSDDQEPPSNDSSIPIEGDAPPEQDSGDGDVPSSGSGSQQDGTPPESSDNSSTGTKDSSPSDNIDPGDSGAGDNISSEEDPSDNSDLEGEPGGSTNSEEGESSAGGSADDGGGQELSLDDLIEKLKDNLADDAKNGSQGNEIAREQDSSGSLEDSQQDELRKEIIEKEVEEGSSKKDLETITSDIATAVNKSTNPDAKAVGEKLIAIAKSEKVAYVNCSKSIFKKFAQLVGKHKLTYKLDEPSRKVEGLFGRELEQREKGLNNLLIIIDVSGSMDIELLAKAAFNTARELLKIDKKIKINLLLFASRIDFIPNVKLSPSGILKAISKSPVVGGGTRMNDVISYLKENKIKFKCCVIISDFEFYNTDAYMKFLKSNKKFPFLYLGVKTPYLSMENLMEYMDSYTLKNRYHISCTVAEEENE